MNRLEGGGEERNYRIECVSMKKARRGLGLFLFFFSTQSETLYSVLRIRIEYRCSFEVFGHRIKTILKTLRVENYQKIGVSPISSEPWLFIEKMYQDF